MYSVYICTLWFSPSVEETATTTTVEATNGAEAAVAANGDHVEANGDHAEATNGDATVETTNGAAATEETKETAEEPETNEVK